MANGRTIYLHIGTEKTGTTTLQSMFSVNRPLLARSGILYPTTPGNMNHVGLPIFALPQANRPGLYSMLQLFTPGDVEAYRNRFAADFGAELERSACKDVILSSEHLSSRLRPPPMIRRLIDLLSKLADVIKVVVYLRPQHELAPSSYSTNVKSGSDKPFRTPESANEYFYNYDLLTRNWERHVGRENVVARIFSRSAFKNGSLVADIFDAMSLTMPEGLTIPEDKNTALGAYPLEFMRLANAVVPRMLDGRVNPDHVALIRLLTALDQTPKYEIGRETALNIERMFLDSNRAVAERYFPQLHGRLFTPVRPTTEPRAVSPSLEALVKIGVDVWQSACPTAATANTSQQRMRPRAVARG